MSSRSIPGEGPKLDPESIFASAVTSNTTRDTKPVSAKKFNAISFLTSPAGLALATFVVVFIILVMLSPPFVQTADENSNGSRTSYLRILLVSGVASILVLVVPFAFKLKKN